MFELGRTYKRQALHDQYGGQRQGGISTPKNNPMVLIFTGAGGEHWGYKDEWEPDGTFRYSGEGQLGPMQFKGGNTAIRDHAANGKDLYLFEADGRGNARFIGQMVCASFDHVPSMRDGDGNLRTAIVFRLLPLEDVGGETLPAVGHDDLQPVHPPSWYWKAPLQAVANAAILQTSNAATAKEARRRVLHRSEAVRVFVQRRANGVCEGCQQPAPFATPAGRPYLEPHHVRRLSDGGPDHPAWVVAVCPVCHKRAHHASDAKQFNLMLTRAANRLGFVEHVP